MVEVVAEVVAEQAKVAVVEESVTVRAAIARATVAVVAAMTAAAAMTLEVAASKPMDWPSCSGMRLLCSRRRVQE